MRIICPNCDAQYEVDASAIPEGGRDVQCSNCGHAWFQEKTDVQEDLTAALYEDPVAEEPPVSEALDQDDSDDAPAAASPAAEPPPVKRSLDDAVLAVLREEAEREIAARKAEAGALETQGDLGLPPPVPPTVGSAAERAARAEPEMNEAERRIKALKGEPVPPPKAAARRDLLPDIEEINSTLRPSDALSDPDDVDSLPDLSRRARSGFRSGFSLMLLLAVIIVAIYIMAPRISEQIPGAAGAMAAYVEVIDGMRAQLDQLIQKATALLRGVAGGGSQ
jgi:predicted Zn finger-like uncharacterized protein